MKELVKVSGFLYNGIRCVWSMTMVTTHTLGDSSGSSSGSGSLIDYIINTTNTSNDVSISAFRSVY